MSLSDMDIQEAFDDAVAHLAAHYPQRKVAGWAHYRDVLHRRFYASLILMAASRVGDPLRYLLLERLGDNDVWEWDLVGTTDAEDAVLADIRAWDEWASLTHFNPRTRPTTGFQPPQTAEPSPTTVWDRLDQEGV